MNTKPSNTQRVLTDLFGQLRNHSDLVHSGISMQQASNIAFHPIRLSNENSVQEVKEKTALSDCCQVPVTFMNDGGMRCSRCSNYCGYYLG